MAALFVGLDEGGADDIRAAIFPGRASTMDIELPLSFIFSKEARRIYMAYFISAVRIRALHEAELHVA